MRRVLAVIVIAVAAATVLSGCHRLGLVSTPAKTAASKATSATATPQGYTISVQNGGGVKGRGAEMVKRLQAAGYKVASAATNAKRSDHATTLIVFKSGFDADAAQIQASLGIGAPQAATPSLEGTTEILVVVGKDF